MDGMDITTPYFRSLNRKQIQEFLTLDNIFRYASEDELRAIVSSIIGRLNEDKKMNFISHDYPAHRFGVLQENIEMVFLNKHLDKFVKELRDVK